MTNTMMQEFDKSGHPVLKCSTPLSRGALKKGMEETLYTRKPITIRSRCWWIPFCQSTSSVSTEPLRIGTSKNPKEKKPFQIRIFASRQNWTRRQTSDLIARADGNTCLSHTKIHHWNSKVEVKFLAKQDSQNLLKWDCSWLHDLRFYSKEMELRRRVVDVPTLVISRMPNRKNYQEESLFSDSSWMRKSQNSVAHIAWRCKSIL